MMKEVKQKLTLDRPATYKIKVPGRLDESWQEWDERITVTFESVDDHRSATTLAGTFDQAALLGLLRRLYSQGLPLISVNWIEPDQDDALDVQQ